MTRRKTQLRDSIYELINHSDGHMTADQVHALLRADGVSIGIATVYRNLNVLFEDGKINRVKHPDYGFIYDKNLHPHNHFICSQCGKVIDVDVDVSVSDIESINKALEGKVLSHTVFFEGLCKDCLKKN